MSSDTLLKQSHREAVAALRAPAIEGAALQPINDRLGIGLLEHDTIRDLEQAIDDELDDLRAAGHTPTDVRVHSYLLPAWDGSSPLLRHVATIVYWQADQA